MMVKIHKIGRREHLRNICKRALAGAGVTAAELKSATMKYVATQYDRPEQVLKRLYHDEELGLRKAFEIVSKELDDRERSGFSGAIYPRSPAFFLDLLTPDDDLDDEDMRTEDDEDVEKAKTKEQPMESLASILKDTGPVSFCKAIVDRGRSPCDERELVAVLTKHVGDDRAFAKLYEAEESVRRACSIAKAAEFSVYDIKPVVVGGADVNPNDPSAAVRAYEEIVRIAREKFPFLPTDVAFARVFEDKNYAALSAQAHRRPQPTTIYAGPGSTAPGRGAYAKADPVPHADTAYAELMSKAEEYRNAHPELSISQAFEKVFTAPANCELAKRERIESAPR